MGTTAPQQGQKQGLGAWLAVDKDDLEVCSGKKPGNSFVTVVPDYRLLQKRNDGLLDIFGGVEFVDNAHWFDGVGLGE